MTRFSAPTGGVGAGPGGAFLPWTQHSRLLWLSATVSGRSSFPDGLPRCRG